MRYSCHYEKVYYDVECKAETKILGSLTVAGQRHTVLTCWCFRAYVSTT